MNYLGTGSQEPDEFIAIHNDDSQAIQLSNWTLSDNSGNTFRFPSYLMQPGQVCRVYTNEYHSEWCGLSFGSSLPIWDNTGDTAFLRDSQGRLADKYIYNP